MNTFYRSSIPRFRVLPFLWRIIRVRQGTGGPAYLLPAGLLMLTLILFLAASTPAQAATDPIESVNRVTFGFNRAVDTVVVRPLAKTYDVVTPRIAKKGLRNFFGNLGELRNAANDVLQLRFTDAARDIGRFAINSTVGVAGFIEVAEPAFGLERNAQDFGRTLAHWGVGSGPYIVLPLLGPSTLRDAFGTGVDAFADPVSGVPDAGERDSVAALRTTDMRAQYLPLDAAISGDAYLFVREMYLQYRDYQVSDGRLSADLAFEAF